MLERRPDPLLGRCWGCPSYGMIKPPQIGSAMESVGQSRVEPLRNSDVMFFVLVYSVSHKEFLGFNHVQSTKLGI